LNPLNKLGLFGCEIIRGLPFFGIELIDDNVTVFNRR